MSFYIVVSLWYQLILDWRHLKVVIIIYSNLPVLSIQSTTSRMFADAAITARAEATAARDRAAEIPALLSEIGSGGAEAIGVRKLSKLLVWRMQQLGVAMPPGLSAQAKNRSALVQLLDGTRTTRPRCRSARRDARRDTRSDECDRSRNCRPCARGGRRSRVPCCRCCRQRRGPRQRERRRER